MKIRLIFACLSLLINAIRAQNTSAFNPILERLAEETLMRSDTENAPIFRFYSYNTSLTQLQSSYMDKNSPYQLQQKGKGGHTFSLQADSYQIIDSLQKSWITARYSSGEKKDVKWNESLDYTKVSPYVMADSVGGNLSFEKYEVNGGYVKQIGTFLYGFNIGYIAKRASRKVDPRPNNTSSNIKATLNVGKYISKNAIISLKVYGSKYTQNNQMSFYNEFAIPALYHFTGLGNYNKLLTGNKKNAYYLGKSVGYGIDLIKINRKGFFLKTDFEHANLYKYMTDFLDLEAGHTKEFKTKNTIGYSIATSNTIKGVWFNAEYKNKAGFESNIFNGSSTDFVKISEKESYSKIESSAALSFLFKKVYPKISFAVIPTVSSAIAKESYLKTVRAQQIKTLEYQVNMAVKIISKNNKWLYFIYGGFFKNNNYDSFFKESSPSKNISINQMLSYNYALLSSSATGFKMGTNIYFNNNKTSKWMIGFLCQQNTLSNTGTNKTYTINLNYIFN